MSLLSRVNRHNINFFNQFKNTSPIFPLNGNVYGFFSTLNYGYFELYLAPWYSGSRKFFVEEIKRTQLDFWRDIPKSPWVVYSESLAKAYPLQMKSTYGYTWTLIDCTGAKPVLVDDLLYSKKKVEEITRLEFIDNENFVCSTVV